MVGRLDRPALVGRPGMVARVDRWHGLDDGRLVVLEHRAGRIAELIGVDEAVEAWRCLLMGQPLRQGSGQTWELYVPDGCLTPVGSMNAGQVAELRREQALEEFEAAMGDLGKILAKRDGDASDFVEHVDERLELAGQQALLEHALQKVAAGSALFELGFRHVAADQDLMRWLLGQPDDKFRFEAIQDPFGLWRLSCVGVTRREWVCDEVTTLAEGPRGELLQPLWRMWREAYPGKEVPQGLRLAEIFLRNRQG